MSSCPPLPKLKPPLRRCQTRLFALEVVPSALPRERLHLHPVPHLSCVPNSSGARRVRRARHEHFVLPTYSLSTRRGAHII
eukprot:1686475-Pleurochrysis_carterae.AAC.1